MKNKNKKLLSAVIMAIISVGFIGCNDDNEDFQVWVCQGSNYNVMMKINEQGKTMYTTVQYNDTTNPTFFGDKVWWSYKNTSDTTIMITVFQNNGADTFCVKGFSVPFEIRNISDDKREWIYFGIHPAYNLGTPYYYIFKRKEEKS